MDVSAREPAGRDIFDAEAAAYDAWYATPRGAAILAEEVAAIQPLMDGLPHPWLEVGVGTGRVAAALGVDIGVDPAVQPLKLARYRGVQVVAACGESLPLRAHTVGAVVITMTLCFVDDPLAVLREARRVLLPGGGLVLGMVLAESPWGQHYRRLAEQGHPYYRSARFLRWSEVAARLAAAGMRPVRIRSTLFWAPAAEPSPAEPREGFFPTAGFTAVLATSTGPVAGDGHDASV